MQELDDTGNRQRWIIRLLLVLAVIVGFVAYRHEASSADSTGGSGSEAKQPVTALALGTDPHGASPRTAALRMPVLPPIATGTLRLEGIVVDQDDHPVGGAHVTLGGRRDATTEADGSFAFDGLAEGEYDLAAESGEWFTETQGTRLDDTSDPVTIKLERGPTLVVHVTDAAARPLAGAKVNIISRERVTGVDGTVRFRAVAIDDELINVTMAGHANVRERVTTSDDPKTTIEKTIVLKSGAEISGTVVDRNGGLVIEAYVDLEPVGGGRSESVWTDETGVFHLPDIGRGSYTAKASSKDAIAAAPVAVVHDGVHAVTGLVLRVEPGGEISGIVVDTAGHPVPEARVSGGGVGETTDKDGRFVAKGLIADKYDLSASTPMLGTVNHVVELGRGQHAEVRIVLTPSSLAGIVVDARGEPVEGAAVFARSENPDGYGYDRTDEYGHFDLGGMPPSAHYKITAQREDSSVEGPSLEVATGNRQIRLHVHDQAILTGRVLLAGKPVPYYGYAVTDDVTDMYTRPKPVRDDDGRFTNKDATPGTVVVVIVGPGFARKVIDKVQIVAGQTTDIGDITVERGEVISGRVVDERGAGIAGATVSMVGSGSSYTTTGLHQLMQGERFATSDASGNYELLGVPPSTEARTVKATHPTGGASQFTTLAVGQSAVDIVLNATGSIDGTAPGNDLRFAVAMISDDFRARYYADVDADGRFSFPSLPPGEYDVDMVGRGRFPTSKVIVTAGKTTTAVFGAPAVDPP
jgi:Carboxypeptidase regulatory-like domain